MRHELIWNGDIKSYYDDFVDNYQLYECIGCKRTSKESPSNIKHTRACRIVKKWKLFDNQYQKKEKVLEGILLKLTPEEKECINLSIKS